MLKELSKPKKGAEFINQLNNSTVYLFHVKDSKTYVVSKSKDYEKVFTINPLNLRPAPKVRKPIGNNKKTLSSEDKKIKNDLNIFYSEALNVIPDKCQECGEDLGCLSAWDARCCTAHILPKSENQGFPSIACHPANRMFLGKKNCSCHTRYDDRDGKFRSTMKIYPVVLAAFEILKEYLTDKEIVKAKKYLNIK